MSEAVEHYSTRFEHQAGTLAGPPWLTEARRNAHRRFRERGFPGPREESWKYTRVAPIEKRRYEPLAENSSRPVDDPTLVAACSAMPGYRLVFLNGAFVPSVSRLPARSDAVWLGSLGEAIEASAPGIDAHLTRLTAEGAHCFSAMNTMFMHDGLYLSLGENTVLDEPVTVNFIASADSEFISHPRVVVALGSGARATLVENYQGLSEVAYFTNAVTEVSLGKGSRLEHYKLQRESTAAFHVHAFDVAQDAHSELVAHTVSLGGALVRNDVTVRFDGPHAACTLNGLLFARGRQHMDFHTTIEHAVPDCVSRERFKGIFTERGRGVFNGRVHVHADAQRTDSEQSNHNLLLSRDAEIDTKPELEIYADDVKCAHGATVGQIDEDMLFYLRSRGIDEELARGMLTYGFARDLLDAMTLDPVRDVVAEVLLDRLPNADQIRSIMS